MSDTLILASASPRRAALLQMIGCRFEVVPSSVDEDTEEGLSPDAVVSELALRKANDIAQHHPDRIVIGADTVVVARDCILGKPADRDDARETLKMLSGSTHHVLTALATICRETECIETALSKTEVTFRTLDDTEIETYLDTSEPYDKAGAYGIQGRAALFAERIDGCFYNVVGFPVTEFWMLLTRITGGRPDHYRITGSTPDLLAFENG
jgi:septum formation protein